MKVRIHDRDALLAVSPAALAAYARTSGWKRGEPYRGHSNVYAGEGLPEIIIPRNREPLDYASVVSMLIATFATVADQDEMMVYRDLVTADRDVIRFRVADLDHSGSLPLATGADLVCGARDMILAAACSLGSPRAFYRSGTNTKANAYLKGVRLGQTHQGSFVMTLLSPVVSPPVQMSQARDFDTRDDPIERRVTMRLAEALAATRRATDNTSAGSSDAFLTAVDKGVSANLCDALATLTDTLHELEISFVWAQTYPMHKGRFFMRFVSHDAPILREASRAFRSREPQLGKTLTGLVHLLQRKEMQMGGTVSLRTSIEGRNLSVRTDLSQSDYERAIEAHSLKAPVVMQGDLEWTGQCWRLLNACIKDVIIDEVASG